MPIYDFKCPACGHRFERLTSMAQSAKAACPKCGRDAARVYEGKWSMGVKPVAGGSGGCQCGGSCAGCSGCRT